MIQAPGNFLTANAANAKQPIFLLSISGYARVFTNYETGVAGQYAWIEEDGMAPLSITVSDIDGGVNVGMLSVTVQDHKGLITADFPTALFEGKTVILKTGLKGMSQSDFATLFTGVIQSVDSANANQSYTFNCFGVEQVLTKIIFTTGDDGSPTDSSHPKTLNGHPLDILISVLENEVGISASQINIQKILGYRAGVYAGMQFTFSIDSPPTAKDFIEQQIMQPLGGYLWVNSKGQFDVNFFYPNTIIPVFSGSLLGAWVDGSGQLVANPFLIANGGSFKVPAGATHLQMGMNDDFFSDNIGSWSVVINGGSPVTVSGTARPYTVSGGLNSAFPFSSTGSSSPASAAVTAGTTIAIAVSGAAGLNSGFGATDGIGNPQDTSPGSRPGDYASPQTVFKTPVANLTVSNTLEIPLAQTADLINNISFRFDKDTSGNYRSESVEKYAASITRFGSVGAGQQNGQQIIQADGVRSGFQGFFIAAFVSRLIFLRYGLKNLYYDSLPLLWSQCVLEPGDIVNATYAMVPDRENGVIGIVNRPMEVMDRSWNFQEGTVTLKLLDASYLSKFGGSLIAPDATPAFASASTDEKAKYLFMANNSDQYSDGSAAHVLG